MFMSLPVQCVLLSEHAGKFGTIFCTSTMMYNSTVFSNETALNARFSQLRRKERRKPKLRNLRVNLKHRQVKRVHWRVRVSQRALAVRRRRERGLKGRRER